MTDKLTAKRFKIMCALLPEGVSWGDPITPEIVNEIVQECMEQVASQMVADYTAELPK